jgi:hypothetical protein
MDKGGLDKDVADDLFVGSKGILPCLVGEHAGPEMVARKVAEGAGCQGDRRIGVEQRRLQRQAAGVGYVVAVHAGHQRRTAFGQTGVQGGNQAAAG